MVVWGSRQLPIPASSSHWWNLPNSSLMAEVVSRQGQLFQILFYVHPGGFMIHIDDHIFQLGWEPTTKHHISFLDFTVDFRELFKVFKLIWLFRTINFVVSRQGVKFTWDRFFGKWLKFQIHTPRKDEDRWHHWWQHIQNPFLDISPTDFLISPPKKKPGTDTKNLQDDSITVVEPSGSIQCCWRIFWPTEGGITESLWVILRGFHGWVSWVQ